MGEKHVLIGRKRDKLGNQTFEFLQPLGKRFAISVKLPRKPFKLHMFGYQACHVCAQLEHVFLPRVHA